MKASSTALEALRNTPTVRTTGDLRAVLSNTLLALVRKEVSATDALATVAVTDGLCNILNTEIKAIRTQLEMHKSSGTAVKLPEFGQLLIDGEKR